MRQIFTRHNRFLLAIGGLALAATALAGSVYVVTESERQDISQDARRSTHLRGVTVELTDAAHDQESALDDYLLSRVQTSMDRFEAAVDAEVVVAEELRLAAPDLPEFLAAVDAAVEGNARWLSTYARPALAAARSGDPDALAPFIDGSTADHEPVETLLEALTIELDQVDDEVFAREAALSSTRTLSTILSLLGLLVAAGVALWLVRRYGRALESDAVQAGVLNRFTEVTSFATDDHAVAAANLQALSLLVRPDAAVTHVLNRSKDRAVPEAVDGRRARRGPARSTPCRAAPASFAGPCTSDDLAAAAERALSRLPGRTGHPGLRAAQQRRVRRRRPPVLAPAQRAAARARARASRGSPSTPPWRSATGGSWRPSRARRTPTRGPGSRTAAPSTAPRRGARSPGWARADRRS